MKEKNEKSKDVADLTADLQEIAEWLDGLVKDKPAFMTADLDQFRETIDKATGKINGLKKVTSKHYDDGKKCNGCNWSVSVLYSFTTNDIDEEGLCGDCFMEMLVEDGRMISAGA